MEALQILMAGLPADLNAAVFVVLHIGAGLNGISFLPEILAKAGVLPAAHPSGAERIQHGRIYVARPDCHLILEDGAVRAVHGPKENRTRPAINPLFRSAAAVYGPRVTGVILTGQLDDGAAGLAEIKRKGGVAVVQDPSRALFRSMPDNAIENVDVDYILSVEEIAGLIARLASTERSAPVFEEPMESTLLEIKCPECDGPIWEERQGKIIEYRCRVGHAYSPLTFQLAQQERVEESLWASVIELENEALIEERLKKVLGPDAVGSQALEYAQAIKALLAKMKTPK